VTYDHREKVGNQGDIVKHAALFTAMEWALARNPETEFIYVESHTGRAEYVLTDRGGWESGIKELASRVRQAGDGERLRVAALHRYVDFCIARSVQSGDKYLGSSGIAFQLILHYCRPYRMILYETEPDARVDLKRYFRSFPSVSVRRGSGLEGLRGVSAASLVLVDPLSLRPIEVLSSALLKLNDQQIPFICWTSRSAGCFKSGWREGGPSLEFYKKTSDFGRLRVRWSAWNHQGMAGCQLTVSRELTAVVSPVVSAIRKAMEWWEE
jgi:hypothetical protein